MDNPAFIRSLYHPLQPAEDNSGKGSVYYNEQIPSPLLKPYIHCFWELRPLQPLATAYPYRVVSDGCIDLIVDCQSFNGLVIAGISDSASTVPLRGGVSYFGIRFLPGGINFFLKFPLHEIQNQMLPMDCLSIKSIDELSLRIFEKNSFEERILITESLLSKQFRRQNTILHPGLLYGLHHILSSEGNLSIQSKAAGWISPRQLQRLFQEHIGCSPKLFARIARFQKTLYTLSYGKPLDTKNAFYRHGYFDQAHFIKEFRQLYGGTPTMLKKAYISRAV